MKILNRLRFVQQGERGHVAVLGEGVDDDGNFTPQEEITSLFQIPSDFKGILEQSDDGFIVYKAADYQDN